MNHHSHLSISLSPELAVLVTGGSTLTNLAILGDAIYTGGCEFVCVHVCISVSTRERAREKERERESDREKSGAPGRLEVVHPRDEQTRLVEHLPHEVDELLSPCSGARARPRGRRKKKRREGKSVGRGRERRRKRERKRRRKKERGRTDE